MNALHKDAKPSLGNLEMHSWPEIKYSSHSKALRMKFACYQFMSNQQFAVPPLSANGTCREALIAITLCHQ